MVRRAVPPGPVGLSILGDLREELSIRAGAGSPGAARRWYWREALGVALHFGLHRLGLGSRRLIAGRLEALPASSRRADRTAAGRGRKALRCAVDDLWADFRLALRTLARTPLAVGVTVASIAVGIGVVTTAFTVANAFLLRPPAGVESPERLAMTYTSEDGEALYGFNSFPDYLSLVEQVGAFEAATAFRIAPFEWESGEAPRPLLAELVTGNYFRVLGVEPAIGRTFLDEETELGSAERLAVVSHRLWQERFGGSPDVLGEQLRLDGDLFTVIGVAPEGLLSSFFQIRVDAWIPLGVAGGVARSSPRELADRADREYGIIGRLAPEVSQEQARAQLSLLAARLHDAYPQDWEDDRGAPRTLTAVSLGSTMLPPPARVQMVRLSGLLLVATGLVLLIACSNAASLSLARANRRWREMAVRVSLGASRRRLVRMLLTESLVPAITGGALGVVLAWWATGFLESVSLLPVALPLRFDLGIDHRVLVFAAVLAAGSSVLFGLGPALEGSRPSLVPSLKSDPSRLDKRARRLSLRNLLVIAQIAGSVILVVAAALLLRTVQAASAIDNGLRSERIAVMSKRLPDDYDPELGKQYYLELTARLASLPGVETAQLARVSEASFLGRTSRAEVVVQGYEKAPGESTTFAYNSVTPGYLEMLDIELLAGRAFRQTDSRGAPLVAVVNESFARRFWPSQRPIGRSFSLVRSYDSGSTVRTPPRAFEVIGIVRDLQTPFFGTAPYFWTPLDQDYARTVIIHLQGRDSAEAMIPLLRREVPEVDGEELTLITPRTLDELLGLELQLLRAPSRWLGYGAGLGLALALAGIYGIVSFAVAQRRHEMAIREAMGALPRQIVQAVVWDGMVLAVWGLVLGILLVLPVAWLLDTQTLGVSPVDPLALGGGAALLLLAALAASLLPAGRLAKLDPMRVLREE